MFSLFCQEIYIVAYNVFSILSGNIYRKKPQCLLFHIRNFYDQEFCDQEFCALGIQCVRNFVTYEFCDQDFFKELSALQFCDQEFFDQELCTCTFKTPDSVFGTQSSFQHSSCRLIKNCGILLELPRFLLHLYQIALAARSQGQLVYGTRIFHKKLRQIRLNRLAFFSTGTVRSLGLFHICLT